MTTNDNISCTKEEKFNNKKEINKKKKKLKLPTLNQVDHLQMF